MENIKNFKNKNSFFVTKNKFMQCKNRNWISTDLTYHKNNHKNTRTLATFFHDYTFHKI